MTCKPSTTGDPGTIERVAFEYVVLKAAPRVDRGEMINVGVVVYCQAKGLVECATHCEPDRLRTLDSEVDLAAVEAALGVIQGICAQTGPGVESARVRFGRLSAPRSTVVHPGPIHAGLTTDPVAELQRLMRKLVY
jgi:hypothetical protein